MPLCGYFGKLTGRLVQSLDLTRSGDTKRQSDVNNHRRLGPNSYSHASARDAGAPEGNFNFRECSIRTDWWSGVERFESIRATFLHFNFTHCEC